jgi:glutamate formiminotransferase
VDAARLLEAVPNFSEGRDIAVIQDIVAAMRDTGARVLDWSADADHHRSVVTLVGSPETVENAAVAAARVARDRINLKQHRGVHPRVGALDVMPFVPLAGMTMADARASARRVGARLAAELGLPVFFYGAASDPPGRSLAVLRRGGFETLQASWPADRQPDLLPERWQHAGAHPTAGITCVGARRLLLAWNVYVNGIDDATAGEVARSVRESSGGLAGVRALALRLPSTGRLQISMNLEDMVRTPPMTVFSAVESAVLAAGGEVEETEVIGMVPDELVLGAAADRLKLSARATARLLSPRLLRVLAGEPEPPMEA